MQIEKLKLELEQLIKAREALFTNGFIDSAKFLDEKITQLETEIDKHLDLIEEVEVDENGEEITSYLLKKNGRTVRLNERIDFYINETPEMYNDDLVFIDVENSGYDVRGIFSFDKNKIIFPFIIQEIPWRNDNDLIHLILNENLAENDSYLADMGGSSSGVHCYLNNDGSFFQNEGIIEEKISSSIYILSDGNSKYKLYDCNSDIDNHIVLSGVNSYEHSDFNLLLFETKDSVGLYDLLNNKLIFSCNRESTIEVKSNNFFLQSFNNFTKVINRSGEPILAYSELKETFQETIEVTPNEFVSNNKEREYYELNLQNEFYRFEKDGINFDNDIIKIIAIDLLSNTNVSINIGLIGDLKIIDIDLIKLNSLVNDLWYNGSERTIKELESEIKKSKQKGINFKLFNFFEEVNIKYLPFNVEAIELINKVKGKKQRLNSLVFNNNSILTEEIINEIGNKFNDDSYFFVNKEGDIEHLLLEYLYLFNN